MSVLIDSTRCMRCGACAEICPGNLIRIRQGGTAFLPHPEECWGCASCLKVCSAGAIAYYLGADIGGGRFSHWIITLPQHAAHQSGSGENPAGSRECAGAGAGRTVTITVDRSDANKY